MDSVNLVPEYVSVGVSHCKGFGQFEY